VGLKITQLRLKSAGEVRNVRTNCRMFRKHGVNVSCCDIHSNGNARVIVLALRLSMRHLIPGIGNFRSDVSGKIVYYETLEQY
jgi:hypothetical protein